MNSFTSISPYTDMAHTHTHIRTFIPRHLKYFLINFSLSGRTYKNPYLQPKTHSSQMTHLQTDSNKTTRKKKLTEEKSR